MELALVENLQREDLNPLETAAAYQTLLDGFGLTKEQLAARLGKSRAAVTNTLRLTRLPESIRRLVLTQQLSEGHARALLPLDAEEAMLLVAERVHAERLSVRRTEEIVRERLTTPPTAADATPDNVGHDAAADYTDASRRLQEVLGRRARIKPTRSGGRVEIPFRDQTELEAILAILAPVATVHQRPPQA
jgi:ParB family chromosome partitioning protein